jgi:hypothetical protein
VQKRYFDVERQFAKENAVLGHDFQAVTSKLRELQAREAAMHTTAAVRVREVGGPATHSVLES